MPKTTLPRIAAVEAAHPYTLRVRWADGGESAVDVTGPIEAFRVFAPLRADPATFGGVKVGDYGTHVAWSDDIDMAATTLWRLARAQSGATLSAEEFRGWRQRQTHTLDAAAKALGVSRRMVAYHEKGEKPIPRTVPLATKALEMCGRGKVRNIKPVPLFVLSSHGDRSEMETRNGTAGKRMRRTGRAHPAPRCRPRV